MSSRSLESGLALPQGERVHYLGHLAHAQVADLFRALDVGIISILDTPFGRYCFPQKAYEMLACGLPVAAADIGQMHDLLAGTPQALFTAGDAQALARAVLCQSLAGQRSHVPIADWAALIGDVEAALLRVLHQANGDPR